MRAPKARVWVSSGAGDDAVMCVAVESVMCARARGATPGVDVLLSAGGEKTPRAESFPPWGHFP